MLGQVGQFRSSTGYFWLDHVTSGFVMLCQGMFFLSGYCRL